MIRTAAEKISAAVYGMGKPIPYMVFGNGNDLL